MILPLLLDSDGGWLVMAVTDIMPSTAGDSTRLKAILPSKLFFSEN